MQAGLKGANAIKPCTASMTFVITIPRCTWNFAWSGRMPSFIILDCFEVSASWVTGQILGLFQLRFFCSIHSSVLNLLTFPYLKLRQWQCSLNLFILQPGVALSIALTPVCWLSYLQGAPTALCASCQVTEYEAGKRWVLLCVGGDVYSGVKMAVWFSVAADKQNPDQLELWKHRYTDIE